MRSQKGDYVWFFISLISFLSLSASFLIMPLNSDITIGNLSIVALVSGLLFWASLVCGIFTQIVISRRVKDWLAANRIRKSSLIGRAGAISFFRNAYAVISDIVTIISLIGLLISMVLTHAVGYICYIFLAVFVFSFCMHCILNGNSFYIISNKDKIYQAINKERTNTGDKLKERVS